MRLSSLHRWACAALLVLLALQTGSVANGQDVTVEEKNYDHNKHVSVTLPKVFLRDVPTPVQVTLPELDNEGRPWPELVTLYIYRFEEHSQVLAYTMTLNTTSDAGEANEPKLTHKLDKVSLARNGWTDLEFAVPGAPSARVWAFTVPAWTSLLPPLATLIIAVTLKQVMLALLVGIWLGCTLMAAYNPFSGLLRTFDTYFVGSFVTREHAAVILFTFLLGGLIGLVQKSGGALGLAQACTRFASSPRRAQFMCWALGVGIFYDDYSCVLISGNALRPVATSVSLAPEKFAYIVHSCAMLPSIMPVSSWVGVELGYIQQQYQSLGIQKNAFVALMETIPYRLYPLLCVIMALLVVVTMRDIGPMYEAEADFVARRPSNAGEATPLLQGSSEKDKEVEENKPARMINALLPFGTVVVVTCVGMVYDGIAKLNEADPTTPHTLVNIIGKADSINALVWASVLGCLVSAVLAMSQRILSLAEVMEAWVGGMREVLEPLFILLLAWSLGSVIQDLGTAGYLVQALAHRLPVALLPAIVATLGFVISFAAGSAFGTMGVMFPLTVPLAFEASGGSEHAVMLCSSAILGSAVFGNHCSPIADNTVLTAMSTGCDMSSHFRTTLPYALLIAGVSLVFGFLPSGFFEWYSGILGTIVCTAVLFAALMFVGKRPRMPAN